jgi:hypothetical protein
MRISHLQKTSLLFPVCVGLCAFLMLQPTFASDYYFSNCATGGAGDLVDPYCLDPDGDGIDESIEFLMDGTGVEVGPGDTIFLCAGACDGAGSTAYLLEQTITPTADGTPASPITIQAFPGETVALDGGARQGASSGLNSVINQNAFNPGVHWYVWKDIIFEHSKERMIHLRDPQGWVFDNIEVRYTGYLQSDISVCAANCDGKSVPGKTSYAFFVKDLNAGDFTVRNSRFHHICAMVFRNNNNRTTGTYLIENNTFYNSREINNDFDVTNQVWRNNVVWDTGGFSPEDRNENIIIEDNNISCRGTYDILCDGSCNHAIKVSDGDLGSGGTSKNITLRRNRVWATNAVQGELGCTQAEEDLGQCVHEPGWFRLAIQVIATNNSEPINIVIENNMVWHRWPGLRSGDDLTHAGISVSTNRNEVYIQNNTIYDSDHGISVNGIGGNRSYTIRNNLIIMSNNDGVSQEGIWIGPNATASQFFNNNIHGGGLGGPIIYRDGTEIDCAEIGSFGTGNKCGSTTFLNVSGPISDWDLHLPANDTVNKDAGTAGAADDIDRHVRVTASTDIGADEIDSDDTEAPAPTKNLRVVVP